MMRTATNQESPRSRGPDKQSETSVGELAGWLVGTVVGAIGFVIAVMFSLVLVAVVLGAAMIFGGWFWWRTRKLRQQLREQSVRGGSLREREVQGEVIRMDTTDRQ